MDEVTLDKLYHEFNSFKDTLDRWRVRVEARQDKHNKTLYGNGEAGLDERLRNTEKTIAKLEKIAESVQPMVVFYKVGMWIAALVGASLIALIWSLIIGQAEIFFR